MALRKASARRITSLWSEQPGLFYGHVVDVATALAVGLVLILDGRARTNIPVFQTINANGGPAVWGAIFLIAAVFLALCALHSIRALIVTLWAAALLYALLALFFGYAAAISPDASHLGVVIFLRAAATHVTRSDVYRHGPTIPE
jgi:hypothetical protein